MKRLAFIPLLAMSACSNTSVPENGYGDIAYGMSVSQLERLGLSCKSASECTADNFVADTDSRKPFGKSDRVTANLSGGKVTSIDATFLMYNRDELIEAYRQAYGDPDVCRHSGLLASTIERHTWTADNGSTVSVSKILDYGAASSWGLSNARGSSVSYRDVESSLKFKSNNC